MSSKSKVMLSLNSDQDLDWVLQAIISGKMNLQNISVFNSHSAFSYHQDSENSLCINISSEDNIQELSKILTALTAQESVCNTTNTAFHSINWEMKMLDGLSSLLDNNASIKHVEFQKNIFSTEGMSVLSDILGRNKKIRSIIFSECQIERIGATLLASALMKNDTLEELQIWEDSIGSNGAEELSRMIEVNSTLKLLLILDKHFTTAAPIISAVLARNCNLEVHLWSKDETGKNVKIVEFRPEASTLRIYKLNSQGSQRVTCALGLNTTIKTLDMTGIQLNSKWAKEFRQVLEQNRSLKEAKLTRTGLGDKAAVYIAAGLFKNNSLESIALDGNRFGGVGVEHLLCPMSRFSLSQNQANTTLRYVAFGGRETRIGRGGLMAILRMLDTNKTIIQLSISEDVSMKPEDVVRIFKGLEKNDTLRSLSLRGCKGVNGELVLQSIMATLQVNPWIEEIDLTGTPLQIAGKAVAIYDKLGRNGTLVSDNEVLDDMALTTPKCCRVFFCGSDFAGKSTLCSSIYHNLSSAKLPYMDQIRTLVNPVEQIARIAEVRIKILRDGDTKISLWNLSDQHDIFALHDIMFPGNGSSSCFFIISSLLKRQTNKEPKSPEEIEDEFLYWLRFVVLNFKRAQSQTIRPHITIVLTHSDKVQHLYENLRSILTTIIQKLREKFQEFVELYPTAFMVDARSSVSVSKLTHHLRKTSMTILQRAPKLYQICNEMMNLLSVWRSENYNKSVIKWSEFCKLCQLNVPSLRIRSRNDNMENVEKRRQAVASSLHLIDEVIFFQELGYLILDSMWFFGNVLKQLTKLDSGNVNKTNRNGFFSWLELEKILQWNLQSQILGSYSKIIDNLEIDDLIKIMLKLELCYEQNPGNLDTLLFIPSLLLESQGRIPTWELGTTECNYVGRQLECHDVRQMFPATGFFPRLQGNSCKKINEQKGASYSALEKCLISIIINGIQIRVEFGTQNGYYVDILACSIKTSTEILRLIRQLIVPAIQNVCPGTTLLENVIRPDCVRYFIPPTFRRNQLVSLQFLQEALLSTPAECMYDYHHTWSSIYNGNRVLLYSGFDYARNLLSDEDFHGVLHQRYNDLHHLAAELTVPFEHNKKQQPQARNDDGEQTVEPSLLGIAKGVDLVLQRLTIIEHEIKDLKQEIQGLRYYEHCLLVELDRKVDYLVNYNIQLEERKVPNMFYFVQEQNSSRMLVTRIISGMTALRLHMLCEYRSEMHVIEEQRGCELLQVDNEVVKCLLPYMTKFMKLLTFALKIGAHFAVGMGDMIPDLGKEVAHLLDSSLVHDGPATMAAGAIGAAAMGHIAVKSNNAVPCNKCPGNHGQYMGDAQQWLVDFLKKQKILTGKDIADRFGLWRVRYLDNGHIAWICQTHKETKRKEITEVPC